MGTKAKVLWVSQCPQSAFCPDSTYTGFLDIVYCIASMPGEDDASTQQLEAGAMVHQLAEMVSDGVAWYTSSTALAHRIVS